MVNFWLIFDGFPIDAGRLWIQIEIERLSKHNAHDLTTSRVFSGWVSVDVGQFLIDF